MGGTRREAEGTVVADEVDFSALPSYGEGMVLHSWAAANVAEDEDDDSRFMIGVCTGGRGSGGLELAGEEVEEEGG